MQLNKFEPFPKNPTISKVFREIGYADELGSGMRNTNKYTQLYSGAIPVFIEDNIFQIIIPMDNVATLQVGPEVPWVIETNKETNKETVDIILDLVKENPEATVKRIAQYIGISESGVRYHINKMRKEGILEHIGSTKNGSWKINNIDN